MIFLKKTSSTLLFTFIAIELTICTQNQHVSYFSVVEIIFVLKFVKKKYLKLLGEIKEQSEFGKLKNTIEEANVIGKINII